jgi:diguanylate cyclase (GGDEF)-like protein
VLSDLDTNRAESTAQAEAVAEKIRATLSGSYLLTVERENGAATTLEHHCSVSIGVALFLGHEASQDDILKWADAAMYEAKETGRDQIRFHGFAKA